MRFQARWLIDPTPCSTFCASKEWSASARKTSVISRRLSLARNGAPDRIVGYTGSASISFRTTPDKLGTLLSGSLEHGANTINQTQFSPLESEVDAGPARSGY